MKNYLLFQVLIVSFLLLSCEEEPVADTTPPTVTISSPSNSSFVSEITMVNCTAIDNDSVKVVELWIDSVAMNIVDSISPYEFLWNTVSYDDSSQHTIMVKAEDINENISESDPISVTVDNSTSYPDVVNILSIDYTLTDMTISHERSNDSDFFSYELLSSESEDDIKYSLNYLTGIDDTIVYITEFDPLIPTWYWARVTDIHGYSTISPGYYILDAPPQSISLDPINFLDSLFFISWSNNNDPDFYSYSLFESSASDMTDAIQIFQIMENNTLDFSHYQIEQSRYTYYQIIVQDYWGQTYESNIEKGTSWTLFNEAYGDFSYDYGRSIIQTSDEGYIIVGNTSTAGNSFSNVFVVKTDVKGTQEWTRNITYSPTDRANSVAAVSDGGYIIIGNTISQSDESSDVLLIKMGWMGNVEWSQSYGTDQEEIGNSVSITSDGGYILCGQTVSPNTGFSSAYLIKVDEFGNESWSRTFGADGNDYGYSVIQSDEGGYVIAGITRSAGDSDGDAWIIKTDGQGLEQWSQIFGGDETEAARAIKQTFDGGFIIIGHTNSIGSGNNDAFLVKTDSEGIHQWSQTYGGAGTDHGRSVDKTDDGYFISGYTDSYGTSGFQFWLIKTDLEGNLQWEETYGGGGDDRAYWGQKALDGGYVVTGYSNSNDNSVPDVILIKTDDQGKLGQEE